MDPEQKRIELEEAILRIIEEKLTNGSMEADRAQAIARMILDKLHPPLSLEQIYAIAPTLDDEFEELATAVMPLTQEHDQKVRDTVAEHATALIKSGKFDEADKILKEALKSKVQPS